MTENNKITMEIINSERFHRANIKFNGIPKEEIHKELNTLQKESNALMATINANLKELGLEV